MKLSILNRIWVFFLGLLIGSVLGSLLDKLLEVQIFSYSLFKKPITLDLYILNIIQGEIRLTPASLVGLVVTVYLVYKKGD